MPSPTELARNAATKGDALRIEFELFRDAINEVGLPELRQRFAVVESLVSALRKEAEATANLRQANAVLEEKVSKLEKRADAAEKMAERLAVLESHQADAKKAKEESDRRQWQFVYIFAGAMATLLVTLVVQLVLALVRKP